MQININQIYQMMISAFGLLFSFIGGVDALFSVAERLRNRIRGGQQ